MTVFLVSWLPYFLCGIITDNRVVYGKHSLSGLVSRVTCLVCDVSRVPISDHTALPLLAEASLAAVALGALLNPLIHPGQNKDVQEIVKKFFVRRKVKQRDFCELVTVNKNECEEAALATGGEEEHEWWIIIKLQVDRLGRHCSRAAVEQLQQLQNTGQQLQQLQHTGHQLHLQQLPQLHHLEQQQHSGHAPDICECPAPECRGTGV